MASEQAPPLLWRNLTFSSSSAGLNVSLRNDPRKMMLAVAFPLPNAKRHWILGPLCLAPFIDSFSIFPIVSAPARPLLLDLKSPLLSVLSLCPLAQLYAVSLIPLAAVLGIPTLMHAVDLARVLSAPFATIGTRFSRVLLAPPGFPLALILTLVRKVFSVPLLLILALVGPVSAYPSRIGIAPLPVPSSASLARLIGHSATDAIANI